MPRLIRRRPLLERIQEYLNPYDFLIWVSEEIESREWDDKNVANQIGAALNFVFLVARANSGGGRSRAVDDVFGEGGSGGMGWFGWLVSLVSLSILISGLVADRCDGKDGYASRG
jgi:hypothetical protein